MGSSGTAFGCFNPCFQTFTAQATGKLTSLAFRHTNGAPQTYTFQIHQGSGLGGPMLYSGNHLFGGSLGGKFALNAATAPNVVAGQVYTVRLIDPVGAGVSIIYAGYAGGFGNSQGYPGDWDMTFQVWVTPAGLPGSNIYMTQDGNVGVGTTSPGSAFEVATGNVALSKAGSGLRLLSPDGATCRMLSLDNAGNVVLAPCQ